MISLKICVFLEVSRKNMRLVSPEIRLGKVRKSEGEMWVKRAVQPMQCVVYSIHSSAPRLYPSSLSSFSSKSNYYCQLASGLLVTPFLPSTDANKFRLQPKSTLIVQIQNDILRILHRGDSAADLWLLRKSFTTRRRDNQNRK